MNQLQFERQQRNDKESSNGGEAAGRKALAADSGASPEPASAETPEGGTEASSEMKMDSWEADDGLMSAMGLGEEGAEGGGGGEKGAAGKDAGDKGAKGKAAKGDKGKKKKAKRGPEAGAAGAEGAAGEQAGAAGGGEQGAAGAAVQRAATVGGAPIGAVDVHGAAQSGVSGAGGSLPHLGAIQQSFGSHDVSGVSAHTDGAASKATASMGAEAYATGNSVAFASSSPSLHTAAHEAAHVVQQRAGVHLKGGVGEVGDSYEQHADAVADRVVQGKSAESLLSQMAPGGGGGGVQRKVVQFDIKSDLRSAMDGWGTDEEAMFRRCERATVAEAQVVLGDAALMAQIRGELDQGDMSRVLDGLRAPLADKLRLAMRGWGTDEDYIHRSLQNATPAELATIAADDGLVRQLEGELSGDDLKQVLDKLNMPLARKLRFAVRGWGTDEEYLFRSVTAAPIAEVTALAGDAATMAAVDADLSGDDLHRFRGTMAKRIYLEGGNALAAFRLCMGSKSDRAARLRWIGDVTVQRALLDAVIIDANPGDVVIQAFQSYWEVETTVVEGATAWNPVTVVAIHRQMKLLPSQDTRAGVWNELQLTGGASLINRAAWNGSALIVGANISASSGGGTMGYGSTLTAPAAATATTLEVLEGPRFAVNDVIAVDRNNAAVKDSGKITGIAGNTLTIDTALVHAHSAGDQVTPDDNTALRTVPYLDATVRHEIAHAVETTLGGVTGFTEGLGGWWTGTDIDTWTAGMANPWTPNDGTTISAADIQTLKTLITDHATGQKGSLVAAAASLDAAHPLVVNLPKAVPAITAAEACLSAPGNGENFWQNAGALYASGGKRFTISGWYKVFMSHKEEVVGQRLADYQLFAPAEFFAEAYTVFYEEADKLGTAGFTEGDLGRLVRNAGQREWIRSNVHNRGQAPAAPGPAGGPGPTTPGSEAPAGVARAGGAGYGKRAGNPG